MCAQFLLQSNTREVYMQGCHQLNGYFQCPLWSALKFTITKSEPLFNVEKFCIAKCLDYLPWKCPVWQNILQSKSFSNWRMCLFWDAELNLIWLNQSTPRCKCFKKQKFPFFKYKNYQLKLKISICGVEKHCKFLMFQDFENSYHLS